MLYIIRCNPFCVLTYVKYSYKIVFFLKKYCDKVWCFGKKPYLCTRFSEILPDEHKKKEFIEIFTYRQSSTRVACLICFQVRHAGYMTQSNDRGEYDNKRTF